MTYPRINSTQLQSILSGKVQVETFSTLKSYTKNIFVNKDNNIYYSLTDISAGAFKPHQWQKVVLLSDFDTKQDKITSTGSTNLLTAPTSVGGQPGKIEISSLEPAFTVLSKSKGGTGKDLSNILKSANADNILVIDSNGNIINAKTLDKSQLSEEINDLLDNASTSVQPTELNEVKIKLDNHVSNTSNPHNVTKEQLGLGNVDNTSDLDKPISTATQEALDLKANDEEVKNTYVKKSGDTITGSLEIGENTDYTISYNEEKRGLYFKTNGDRGILLTNDVYEQLKPISNGYMYLGDYNNRWGTVYTLRLNNGEDLTVPKVGGTLARIEDLPEVPVQSVNSKTGDIVLTSDDINATIGETSYTLQETLDLKANSNDVYTKLESNNLLDKKLNIDTAKATYVDITSYDEYKENVATDIESINKTLDAKANQETTYTKDEVDTNLTNTLKDYVKFTDYASISGDAGLIRTSSAYGTQMVAAGYIRAGVDTLESYKTRAVNFFVGKGTLENIKNDLVKRAITENDIELTDTEKQIARTWIGAGSQADLDTKANQATTYTKDETDTLLNKKLDIDTATSTYETIANFTEHKNNTSNPHSVTKAQVGLGNVDNTSDLNKPISTATQTALDLKANKADVYDKSETYNQEAIDSKIDKKLDIESATATYATISNLNSHTSNTSNPHNVTKEQLGLGNVDNTSDLDKPISTATQKALNAKANIDSVNDSLSKKQDTLVSGTNIKTINNESLLGSTNIKLQKPLSGSNGNVVVYTNNEGTLGEIGFDNEPIDNSDNLLKSGVIYDSLSKKINYTDIVNDVTSGGTNKPLSAEQGKELSNRINLVAQSTHDRGVVLNALNSQGKNYSVTSVLVNNGGSGYTLGDALFLISEELKIDSIITVDEVDALGTIKVVSISQGGSFIEDPTGSSVKFIGGTGSNATFNVTSMLTDNLTLKDIANPNPNDFATVLQDELHDNLIYVWKYADFNGDGVFNWVSGYPVQTEDRDFNIEPITNSELASNSVSTVKILNKNVTLDKLADDSVNGDKIIEGSITNVHIADDALIAQNKISGLVNDLNSKANQSTTYTKTEVDGFVNSKQNAITGAASTITNNNLSVNRVVISNADGKIDASTITSTELSYLDNVTSNIQTQLDNKANKSTTLSGYGITNAYTKDEVNQKIEDEIPNFTGAVSTIIDSNLNNNRVVISDANGKITDSEITSTELGYLDNVTSNIQTQLDNKANKSTTLSGYGITNAYTKDEADGLLAKKLDAVTASSTYATIVNLNSHETNYNNPHKVTKAQVGLGNVDNTSDLNKPISTATQKALDAKANNDTIYTKTETDTLLNNKLDINVASNTYTTIDNFENHTSNVNNPHKVTKVQVGLGNVDNTSDLNKPISTATQEALDNKINIYQGADNANKPLIVDDNGNVTLGDTLVQPTVFRRWA